MSRIKNSEKELSRSYWEVSIAMWSWWIEKLLSIYRAYRNFLDGSRSCREAIKIKSQKLWWIEIAIIAIKKGSSRDSIDSLDVERYQNCFKIVFQRREKHIYECNQACYSTNNPNNILNSQKHLSTKKEKEKDENALLVPTFWADSQFGP